VQFVIAEVGAFFRRKPVFRVRQPGGRSGELAQKLPAGEEVGQLRSHFRIAPEPVLRIGVRAGVAGLFERSDGLKKPVVRFVRDGFGSGSHRESLYRTRTRFPNK
jgi:hypothetical protein